MKDLIKKWWFWVVILVVLIVICFSIIMAMAFNVATKGINEVALAVQSIDSDSTVYTSAGENTIIIEIPNYSDDTKKYKEEAIETLIKSYASGNGILSNYSKAILCEKTNSNDNFENYFLSIKVYSLPNMIQDVNLGNVYVDFVEYTERLLNTKSSTNNNTTIEKGEDATLTAGKYVVGPDIKAGKYDVIAQAGSGNFFVNGSNSVNEMLSVDTSQNAKYGYIDKYTNLTLKNGDTIELRSNLKILLQAK